LQKQGKVNENPADVRNRWGYKLRRNLLQDFFDKSLFGASHPLQIGFSVTEADLSASAGDYFTALELGEQLKQQFGWNIFYLSENTDWYDMTLLDVIVVMRDDYDLRLIKNAKPILVKVMWARNWFERWATKPWTSDYDCVWCSSNKAANYLRQKLAKPVTLMRIATNPDRFQPVESSQSILSEWHSDYCFTGSYWNYYRDILEFLEPSALPYNFALYGSNWEKVEKFQPWYRGAIPYTRLFQVYAATKIVIDDANTATKEWGSVNSRVFDALAVGALVITNGQKGSEEVFGGLLPTFDSRESLEALLHEYLTNEPKRRERVAQLQQIVCKHHTYEVRANRAFESLRSKLAQTFRIALKIGVPHWEVAEEWGDYHFARAMKRAFERQGHSVRIDILPDWDTPKSYGDDVVIVLRGLSRYEPKPHHINIMWNISHPEAIALEEYEQYWAGKVKIVGKDDEV
jgi:O-antigen biosynthesis protein